MKREAARALNEIRQFCQIAQATTPVWVRVLFAASLGALFMVNKDHPGRWGTLSGLTDYYIALNIVVLVATAGFLGTRIYREYIHRRAAGR